MKSNTKEGFQLKRFVFQSAVMLLIGVSLAFLTSFIGALLSPDHQPWTRFLPNGLFTAAVLVIFFKWKEIKLAFGKREPEG